MYNYATNYSRISLMYIPGDNFSVLDFKVIRKHFHSINVECIGIGHDSVVKCNDICLYIQRSKTKCVRILGVGGDVGNNNMVGQYNVAIIDDFQEDNDTMKVEKIYVSMFKMCLPFYQYEVACVNEFCETFDLYTESCYYDSLILFLANHIVNSAVLIDMEGRVSSWNMLTYGLDNTVYDKITPYTWFNADTASSFISNGSSVGILNTNVFGKSILIGQTKFVSDYSNSLMWIKSNSDYVYGSTFKSHENGVAINSMYCEKFRQCKKCGLCFNFKCEPKITNVVASMRYSYGAMFNACMVHIKQDVIKELDFSISLQDRVIDVGIGGMRPFQISLERWDGYDYVYEVLAANWTVCVDSIRLMNDSKIIVNYSDDFSLRVSYVGFDYVFKVSVVNRYKRELITHEYHPNYKYNLVTYTWWYGYPMVGNRLTLYSSYRNRGGFYEYQDKPGVFHIMKSAGVFAGGRLQNIIFLVHGWHAYQSSSLIFKQLTRQHQKMTPNATVLFVNWERQGANDRELGNAAWSAVRTNLEHLLRELPYESNIHCVGHSLGGHACGGICRQYRDLKGKNCTRIVSLDPASVQFKYNSPDQTGIVKRRINRHDADYVAVIMTNRNFMGLHDLVGDEYITTNALRGENDGYSHEGCPAIGKWWGRVCTHSYYGYTWCEDYDVGTMFNSYVVPHVSDSCSHMMAPIQYAKFLDVWSPASIERTVRSDSFMSSSWSAYVTSMDRRYKYEDKTIWYSFKVDSNEIFPRDVVTLIIGKHDWTPTGSHIFPEFCKVYKNVKKCVYFVMGDRVRQHQPIKFDSGFARLPFISRIRRSDGVIPDKWKKDLLESGDFWQIVQSTEVRMNCRLDGWCTQSNERTFIPSSRSMLSVHGRFYPLDRCVFNDSIEMGDVKISKGIEKRCVAGSRCKFEYDEINPIFSQNEIMIVKMWSKEKGWEMLFYYGVRCSNVGSASVMPVEDAVYVEFNTAGNHILHFVFNYDKVEISVKVISNMWNAIGGPKYEIKDKSYVTTVKYNSDKITQSFTQSLITSHSTITTTTSPSSIITSPSSNSTYLTNAYTNYSTSFTHELDQNDLGVSVSDGSSKIDERELEEKEENSNLVEFHKGENDNSVVASINSNTSIGIVVGIIGMILVAAIIIAVIKYRKPNRQVNVIVRGSVGSKEEMSVLNGYEDSSI